MMLATNHQTNRINQTIEDIILSIIPHDELEQQHIIETLDWIRSGAPLFRIKKPTTPPKHLVSYFALIDEEARKILLVDHKKAQLWVPSGGHVELDEHPADAASRECLEELGIGADFWQKDPLFITSTVIVGLTPSHTDISLWYVLKGDHRQMYTFAAEEFNTIRWFGFDEIPYERTDPHMARFIKKLKNKIQSNSTESEKNEERDIIKAFIKPNYPVVLSKKLKQFPYETMYFYFCVDSELRLITEQKGFIHRYTVRFCELYPKDGLRVVFNGYDGYSLTMTKFEDHLSTKLTNCDLENKLDIIISPRGVGIGSIILNHLFFWAKEKYPEFPVPSMEIHIEDDLSENEIMKKRLYSKIGLMERYGKTISDLTPTIDMKGFEVTPAYKFIREMLLEKQRLIKENKNYVENIKCLERKIERLKQKRYKYSIFQIHYQIENLFLCIFDLTIGNLISLFQIVREKMTDYTKQK